MLGKLGRFGDQRLDRCGSDLLERMISRKSTCLRQLAGGRRSDVVRFVRFLANPRVMVDGVPTSLNYNSTASTRLAC